MLQLDDVQLYDLSEAGALLFSDPVRLARLARLRQVPSGRVGSELGLPAPWVDAESGRSDADPVSLKGYWLQRLAPPAPDARRPRRARDRLPAEDLLTPEEAGARLFATAPAVGRLTADGTLPALRVDGAVRYDALLVDMLAAEEVSADERRALVASWARFEYDSAAPEAPAASGFAPFPPAASDADDTPAPAAYEIPADLGAVFEDEDALPPNVPQPPSTLIEAEGFETIDED